MVGRVPAYMFSLGRVAGEQAGYLTFRNLISSRTEN
jgi:hypothetical protein